MSDSNNGGTGMKFTYDVTVDALAVTLAPGAKSARTVKVGPHTRIDLDANGRAIGVEVLDASALYDREALLQLPAAGEELTLLQVQEEYGIDASALRHQIRKGRLTARKDGAEWKVRRAAMETYLENRRPSGRRAPEPKATRRAPARKSGRDRSRRS